jgi:hypothetical protein
MPAKVDKAAADYTPVAAMKSERCALCKHFLPLHDKCRKVEGKISAGAWCKLFSAKRAKTER